MPELSGVIADFPNEGVQLLYEDERIAIWEEIFQPGVATPAHRHRRDYVAILPAKGELTLTSLGEEREEYLFLSHYLQAAPSNRSQLRFNFPACTVFHSKVPQTGVAHVAVNEGNRPVPMILIEIKGTAAERR